MNIQQRVERVRKLMPSADKLPWARDNRGMADALGNCIMSTTRFCENKGYLGSNDVNMEMIEHLSHIAHEDFMVTVPEMMGTSGEINQLQQKIHDQANRLFPKRTPTSAWLKLYEELGEVIKDPNNPDEWGDIFILLFDLAKIHGIDIRQAVQSKMETLEHRVWLETPTGTYQHIPGEYGDSLSMIGPHLDAAIDKQPEEKNNTDVRQYEIDEDVNVWQYEILKRCIDANIMCDDENPEFSLNQLLEYTKQEVNSFDRNIRRFNKMYKLPVATKPSLDQLGVPPLVRLHAFKDILLEELDEIDDIMISIIQRKSNAEDGSILTKLADLLGDLQVYCASEMVKFGLPISSTLDIIMRSNFSKMGADGKPIYDDRGKLQKGPDYWKPEPEIAVMLKRLDVTAALKRLSADGES